MYFLTHQILTYKPVNKIWGTEIRAISSLCFISALRCFCVCVWVIQGRRHTWLNHAIQGKNPEETTLQQLEKLDPYKALGAGR